LKERRKWRGRGWVRELLVKWEGYTRPTWEPANALEETEALDLYKAEKRAVTDGT
jgi:hypothetical protein